MDYIKFCENFFASFRVPLSLLLDAKPVYSSLSRELSYSTSKDYILYNQETNPCFEALSQDLLYGHVRIEGTGYDLIIGPAFPVRPSEELVRQYMLENQIPADYREAVAEALYAIPLTSQSRLCDILCFLHQVLNGVEIGQDFFLLENEDSSRSRRGRQVSKYAEEMDSEKRHSSFAFERELFRLIREGSTSVLHDFMAKHANLLTERKMAQTPLRHAKNEFIITTEKAGILGAIPGGVDEERVYQLMDLYVQECEQFQRTDDVHKLQYIMLMDFCRRSGEAHIPQNLSTEMFQCAEYIRGHINMPISADDVAAHIHRSRSYTMSHFKEELGLSIGAYLTKCRIDAAKSLLADSDKGLAEISLFLCYSSQSHFQNVFKGETGMTPMQYRKEHQKDYITR